MNYWTSMEWGTDMVKYSDIHRAIVAKLKAKFPNIKISSTDITEGFDRPSFFIEFDDMRSSDFMKEALDRNFTVRIYYFPKEKDKNKVEILNMEDDLNEIFIQDGVIGIDTETAIEVDELELEIVDKVLQCSFDVMISENYDRVDNIPNMEDIEIENI